MAYLIEDADAVNDITCVVVISLVLLSGSLFPAARLPGILQFVSISRR